MTLQPKLTVDTQTSKYGKPECPQCGEKKFLRHMLFSKWHQCKQCAHEFVSNCSPHKHGGRISLAGI